MEFDLTSPISARESLNNFKTKSISKIVFYHFTTYPRHEESDLYKGLKNLNEIINNPDTALGRFLLQHHIYIDSNRKMPLIEFKDQDKTIVLDKNNKEVSDTWNSVIQRLKNDSGTNGFFIPDCLDYPGITEAPEFLRSIDMATKNDKKVSQTYLVRDWQEQDLEFYAARCIIPYNDKTKKISNDFIEAAKKAIAFDNTSYDPYLIIIDSDIVDLIEVTEVFSASCLIN